MQFLKDKIDTFVEYMFNSNYHVLFVGLLMGSFFFEYIVQFDFYVARRTSDTKLGLFLFLKRGPGKAIVLSFYLSSRLR